MHSFGLQNLLNNSCFLCSCWHLLFCVFSLSNKGFANTSAFPAEECCSEVSPLCSASCPHSMWKCNISGELRFSAK